MRKHAIAHYLDMAAAGRVDLTGMLTHRFPLERWWDALRALARQDESGAIKVAFEASVSRPGDYDAPGNGTGLYAERRQPGPTR